MRKTLSKVALDQLGFAPVFTVAILGSIGLLQGQSLSNIKVKLENEYVDIMLTGWKVLFQKSILAYLVIECNCYFRFGPRHNLSTFISSHSSSDHWLLHLWHFFGTLTSLGSATDHLISSINHKKL